VDELSYVSERARALALNMLPPEHAARIVHVMPPRVGLHSLPARVSDWLLVHGPRYCSWVSSSVCVLTEKQRAGEKCQPSPRVRQDVYPSLHPRVERLVGGLSQVESSLPIA
jgi:hypothetical protein